MPGGQRWAVTIIRCTKKVRDALGIRDRDLARLAGVDGRLGEWFCNLILVSGQRCLLFTNGPTLYTFLVPIVGRQSVAQFCELFFDNLATNLSTEGFSPQELQDLVRRDRVALLKTNDRRVLGSMNDYAVNSAVEMDLEGGPDVADILAVNQRLNRTPMGTLQMGYAIDALQQAVRTGGPVSRARRE